MSTLIFNGQDLADFGVHISGEGTYNAPSRAVEEQIVPGRNGTLIIDGGRWENIIVTYPAYITDDFDDNMAALRNFLTSVRGYARLADTYHPNEFRLACFSDEITVRTSGRYNAQGQFDLSFNCKPQRFLTSGEEVTTFDASDLPSESFSGNPVTFETDGEYKVSELSVGITPVQDLHGQANPYPAGGGKNKLHVGASTTTINGVTFTVNDDGTVKVNGTATANVYFYLIDGTSGTKLNVPDGSYTLSGCPSGGSFSTYYLQANDGSWKYDYGSGATLTSSGGNIGSIGITVKSGTTVNNIVFKPMVRLSSVSDATYAPYENICPISGRTGLTVTAAGKNLLNMPTYAEIQAASSVVGYKSLTLNLAPNTTYYLSTTFINGYTANGKGMYILLTNSATTNEPWVAVAHSGNVNGKVNGVMTTGADGVLYLRFYGVTEDKLAELYAKSEIQLEVGSTATPYTPSAPYATTYPVTWQTKAGTIYGGTLDVVSGVLTVNRFFKAFDGTEIGWTKAGGTSNNTQRYYMLWENMGVSGGVLNPSDALCSHLVFLAGNAGQFGTFNSTATNFAVKDGDGSQFADINAFKAWLAAQNTNGTPLQLCVELATPQTYNITPTEVKTLLGGNTIYTDAGGVDGKYLLPLRITNPTAFEAKPIIRIYGAGTVGIGDVNVTFDGSSEYVDLDCEIQDAYYGLANKNSAVTLDPNRFPVIPASGAGIVLGSGITQVDITPRWFEL